MVGVMNAIAHASAAPVTGPKLDNRRVAAGIVDLLIVAVGAAVVLFAADALTGDLSEIQGALGAVIVGWALYYHFALESGDGQTVGKKLMKLRVVRADGSPAGMREIAMRTVLRVVDGAGAYIVGLIVMLLTGQRRQRLGDLAAGTIIVDASAPASIPPAPVVEPVDEAEDAEEPADEAPGVTATQTITLPSRPAPPATLSDLAAPETPAAPKMKPFPPVAEEAPEEEAEAPVAEEERPVEEADEPIIEEPIAEEPVAHEPIVEEADEPIVEEPIVEDPIVDEPIAEVVEPVAEEPLPEISSPVIEELAQDVADIRAEEEPAEDEPVAEEPVADAVPVEDEPVVEEPVADVVPVADEPVADEPAQDGPADNEPVNVKSVETVSAIDLIMGGGSEDEASDESAPEPEDAAS
jgi:uncharacterized RDD family membrane protein YckC